MSYVELQLVDLIALQRSFDRAGSTERNRHPAN